MKTHAVTHHPLVLPGTGRPWAGRLVRFVVDRFLLLPIGALIALVWANTAGESYFQFSYALRFAVNDVAMAFFLALLVQEVVEALMPGGALHTWRRWTMPIVAAAGGILGAAGVYLVFVNLKYELLLTQAWPVACAIDVAAAYYVLKLIWRRSSALPFLLLTALATNAIGLLALAFRPAVAVIHPAGALLTVAAVGAAAALRRQGLRSFWPFIALCGPAAWWGLYLAGIPPVLALVPIVPFLPHEPRPLNLFAERPDDDVVHHFEHEWNEVVQIVLFLFGLVNAGVILRHYDTGTGAVLLAALIGRPVGMMAAIGLAVHAGLHLPRRIGWREVVVMALATSSGFTFALLFATALIPTGPMLEQIKLGALATAAGALIALGAARLLRVHTTTG
jgi:Na+:H+ antiporter, NhaA family